MRRAGSVSLLTENQAGDIDSAKLAERVMKERGAWSRPSTLPICFTEPSLRCVGRCLVRGIMQPRYGSISALYPNRTLFTIPAPSFTTIK
jgi:hypothetical protein